MDELKLQELKKAHGDVYKLCVDGLKCYVRKPNRQDLSYISVVKNPIQQCTMLLNLLWIEGDERIKDDDTLFLSVAPKLSDLLELKEAELKKL